MYSIKGTSLKHVGFIVEVMLRTLGTMLPFVCQKSQGKTSLVSASSYTFPKQLFSVYLLDTTNLHPSSFLPPFQPLFCQIPCPLLCLHLLSHSAAIDRADQPLPSSIFYDIFSLCFSHLSGYSFLVPFTVPSVGLTNHVRKLQALGPAPNSESSSETALPSGEVSLDTFTHSHYFLHRHSKR
jgi:hypothetical protein